jgi:hypothetical protein
VETENKVGVEVVNKLEIIMYGVKRQGASQETITRDDAFTTVHSQCICIATPKAPPEAALKCECVSVKHGRAMCIAISLCSNMVQYCNRIGCVRRPV